MAVLPSLALRKYVSAWLTPVHLSQAGTREISRSKSGCPPVDHLIRRERTRLCLARQLLSRSSESRSKPRSFVLSPRVVSAVSPFRGSASRCSLAPSLAVARKSTRDFHRWRARTRETVSTAIVCCAPIRGDPGETGYTGAKDRFYHG